jgi:hypothetical protein
LKKEKRSTTLQKNRPKMGTLIIDNKKFVVIEQKEFEKLLAARSTSPVKKLSIEESRKLAHKLIDKWSKGK